MTVRNTSSQPLTTLQRAILRFIESKGPVTADQVREAVTREHPLKDSSVRTLLRRLEARGLVSHSIEGKTFMYRAEVASTSVAAAAVRRLIDGFWKGSAEQFLTGLVDEKVLSAADLRRLAKKVGREEMNAAFVLDTLLEASARAALVAAMTGATLAAFRVKTPAVRHAAWTGALVVMLALPVTSSVLPTIPLPAWMPQGSLQVAATLPVETVPVALESPQVVTDAIPVLAPEPTRTSGTTTPATIRVTTMVTRGVELSWTWRQWIVLTWIGIAFVFLVRELAGAWITRRLAKSGVPVKGDAHTFASPRVVTPVVVGVLAPRVMVPPSWPKWGAGVREMVLLHERAHVSRRDPLVASLARLNRAVFWFHPLSWWMQGHLSRTAEQACDELVVRTVPEPRVYAALLVEMAKRLHHHNGRVVWQGIGVVDGGRFEDRVDRVLKGTSPQLTRRKMAALALVSTLLISLAVACGTTAAAPLAEDPELAKRIEDNAANFANYEAAIKLNLEQAKELEKVAASNPDDLNAASQLLIFYLAPGPKLMGWNEMVAARRALLLRLIERHPESSLVTWRLSRRLDIEGYDKARALWMTHVERADASVGVLSQAATFFERVEKPLAEEILLRGIAKDPGGPTPRVSVDGVYRRSWSRRLGILYGMAIAGSHDMTSFDEVTTVDPVQLQSPFAKQVRQKLDASNDPVLLLGAGVFLIDHTAKAKLDFDPAALGREYVAKAFKLDSTLVEAKRILNGPDHDLKKHNEEFKKELERFGSPAHALSDAELEQLPDATKLEYARELLWSPYGNVMGAYRRKDNQAVEAAFASLKSRTDMLQRLVDSAQPSTVPTGLQFDLHAAFGTCAMHQGNRQEAVRRLGLAASAASAAWPVEQVGMSYAAGKLAHDLLDLGERESVAAFYDSIASRFANEWKTTYVQAAKAIREGRMPADYQRYRARLQ